jgi:hypothetical protein
MTRIIRASEVTHGDVLILPSGTQVVSRLTRWMGFIVIGHTVECGLLAWPDDPITVHKLYDPDNPARTRNRKYSS